MFSETPRMQTIPSDIAFTPAVKAIQERKGSRQSYARMERSYGWQTTVTSDLAEFFKDLSVPFYGANRPGANVSQGLRGSFGLQGMQAGFKAVFDCIKAFSETDFTEDLKKLDVPTLIIHGDDDSDRADRPICDAFF